MLAFEAHEEEATTSIDKPPSELNTGSNWKPFKEGVIAYFNYVIQEHETFP
jgi:hypothetical protein